MDGTGECRYYLMVDDTTGMTLVLRQSLVFSAPVLGAFYLTSLMLGLLSLGLCLLCARWLSGNLSEPVDRLGRAMGRVMEGDLTVQLQTKRVDELGKLAHSFNQMTREYRANLERSVEHQRELNETRIRMMQAQLNPHFLYNTLDSMKWLGVTHQVPQIASWAALQKPAWPWAAPSPPFPFKSASWRRNWNSLTGIWRSSTSGLKTGLPVRSMWRNGSSTASFPSWSSSLWWRTPSSTA